MELHAQDIAKDQFDLNATNAEAIYLPIEFPEPVMLARQIFH